MTDELTASLRAAGQTAPLSTPPPAAVRARGEQRRRTRRLTGGVVAGVIAVLVTTGLLVSNLRSAQPAPPISPPNPAPPTATALPARTPAVQPAFYDMAFGRDKNVVLVLESSIPSDRPTIRLERALETAIPSEAGRCPDGTGNCSKVRAVQAVWYELGTNPTLTEDDLNLFEDLSIYRPNWTELSTSDGPLPTLTTCFPGPQGMGAAKAHVAAYVDASGTLPLSTFGPSTSNQPGYLVETILQFNDTASAATAYATIRSQATSCDYSPFPPLMDGPISNMLWPVDEVFIADFRPAG